MHYSDSQEIKSGSVLTNLLFKEFEKSDTHQREKNFKNASLRNVQNDLSADQRKSKLDLSRKQIAMLRKNQLIINKRE